MERDKVLIEEFIQGFNDYSGTTYRVTTQPDKLDRQNEAIDAIAYDDSGQILRRGTHSNSTLRRREG